MTFLAVILIQQNKPILLLKGRLNNNRRDRMYKIYKRFNIVSLIGKRWFDWDTIPYLKKKKTNFLFMCITTTSYYYSKLNSNDPKFERELSKFTKCSFEM